MLSAVTPVQPVAPWLGGKRNLAKRICAIIDAVPCSTYAEPFVGMGASSCADRYGHGAKSSMTSPATSRTCSGSSSGITSSLWRC